MALNCCNLTVAVIALILITLNLTTFNYCVFCVATSTFDELLGVFIGGNSMLLICHITTSISVLFGISSNTAKYHSPWMILEIFFLTIYTILCMINAFFSELSVGFYLLRLVAGCSTWVLVFRHRKGIINKQKEEWEKFQKIAASKKEISGNDDFVMPAIPGASNRSSELNDGYLVPVKSSLRRRPNSQYSDGYLVPIQVLNLSSGKEEYMYAYNLPPGYIIPNRPKDMRKDAAKYLKCPPIPEEQV